MRGRNQSGLERVKFLCDQCKAKYRIADDKVAGKTVRMKCRKCGHLIEVRSAVTESSVASIPPAAPTGGSHPPARPATKPAPPRSTSLAASLTSTRSPAAKPDRPAGALAGAFKTTVQREDEVSAPFDMSELSPGDDWYVAINGVPVGPIRIAEVRRKAALGAVTEDSLVWQEGLDEWRPLRAFPDLAKTVREAATVVRTSITPPPTEARSSLTPPPPRSTSARPATAAPMPRGVAPRPFVAAPPPRNNVVPIMSRLATAEKLPEPAPVAAPFRTPFAAPVTDTHAVAAAVVDPFHPAVGAGLPPSAAFASADAASIVLPPGLRRRGPNSIVIAMIATFISGGLAAMILTPMLTRPSTAPTPSGQGSAAPAPPPAPTPPPQASQPSDTPAPIASAPAAQAKGALAMGGGPRSYGPTPAPAATSTGPKLDLSGLAGGPRVAPTDEVGGDTNRAAGQCITEGQIVNVLTQHRPGITRTCWDRNPTPKPSVNITVALTVGPDGSAQGVSASGDDPAVAHCIENDVRNWHFAAMGCSQKISVPFKFVRQ